MKDGGPAFPTPETSEYVAHDGMSLRAYFAAAALTGLLARDDVAYATACRDALEYADEMIAALERKDGA